jgi:hypothetical protein
VVAGERASSAPRPPACSPCSRRALRHSKRRQCAGIGVWARCSAGSALRVRGRCTPLCLAHGNPAAPKAGTRLQPTPRPARYGPFATRPTLNAQATLVICMHVLRGISRPRHYLSPPTHPRDSSRQTSRAPPHKQQAIGRYFLPPPPPVPPPPAAAAAAAAAAAFSAILRCSLAASSSLRDCGVPSRLAGPAAAAAFFWAFRRSCSRWLPRV